VVIGVEKRECNSGEPFGTAIIPLIEIAPAISSTNPTYLELSPAILSGEEEQNFTFIIQVRIRDGYYCGSTGPAGQPCSGVPFTYLYKAMGKECVLCPEDRITLATWTPAQKCNEKAILTFTNPKKVFLLPPKRV